MRPTAESIIVLRVSRQRKASYVRAALASPQGPQTLAAWCFDQLDRAANSSPLEKSPESPLVAGPRDRVCLDT